MYRLKVIRKTIHAVLTLSAFCFLLSAFCLVLPYPCWGQGLPRIGLLDGPEKLSLMVGESKIFKINEKQGPAAKVELVDPKVADAIVLTPWQIYISAKAPGITTLVLRGKDGAAFYTVDLEVYPDTPRLLSHLKETLYKILPDEKDIKVTANGDYITLFGTVSSSSNLSQVLAITQSYLPKEGKVINLMEVAGVHQVMLEVRVAEMSRSLIKRLGFNFAYLSKDASHFGLSLLKGLTSIPGTGFPSSPIEVTESINAIFRFMSNDTTWTVFIDAMKENGLLKILAEPTLITLSGKTANFLAGGEFPVPVPQPGAGGTSITIEYKPFGVGLNFTPTVLSNKKISMHVAPEVSELDFSRALTIGGFVVPSLTTRRASTVIELGDGQSFAIAGLLKDEVREVISKFPLLGDIPVLGAIFRSSSFQKNETELVIIVTPRLVKPLDLAKQTLPIDQFIEPDDFEFYLLGIMEGREKPVSPTIRSDKGMKMEGSFGHIVPK